MTDPTQPNPAEEPQAAPEPPSPEETTAATAADPEPAEAFSLDSLRDVSMPVVIEFGRTSLTVEEILALKPGSVIALDRMVGEPADILVSDRKVAEGEVVVLGERFGIRVTRMMGDAA